MSVLAIPQIPAIFSPVPDPACGDDAAALSRADDVPNTSFYHAGLAQPLQDLFAAIGRADSGQKIRPEALPQAMTLLESLPAYVPTPEIVIERDGQIGFDWHLARDRSLSLNVGRGGMLGFASLNGPASSYGRVPFVGTLPVEIVELLAAVLDEKPSTGRR